MYKKYNPCPPQPKLRFEAPYTPHQSSPGPGAIPESVRVTSEQCNPVWLTTAVVPICQSTFTSPVVTPPNRACSENPGTVYSWNTTGVCGHTKCSGIINNASECYCDCCTRCQSLQPGNAFFPIFPAGTGSAPVPHSPSGCSAAAPAG